MLRARVLSGEWDVGERLPSRARLAEEYGVGRNVVQRAMDRLIAEGLLEGRAGSGTSVRTPRERLRLVRSRHHERRDGSPRRAGTSAGARPELRERGRADSWDAHSQVRGPAPEAIAGRLGQGRVVWLAPLVTCPPTALMPHARPGWSLYAAAVGLAALSLGGVVRVVSQSTFQQVLTPDRLQGRMNATARFVSWGGVPLGGVLGGVSGALRGAGATLWIGAIGMTLSSLVLRRAGRGGTM